METEQSQIILTINGAQLRYERLSRVNKELSGSERICTRQSRRELGLFRTEKLLCL